MLLSLLELYFSFKAIKFYSKDIANHLGTITLSSLSFKHSNKFYDYFFNEINEVTIRILKNFYSFYIYMPTVYMHVLKVYKNLAMLCNFFKMSEK